MIIYESVNETRAYEINLLEHGRFCHSNGEFSILTKLIMYFGCVTSITIMTLLNILPWTRDPALGIQVIASRGTLDDIPPPIYHAQPKLKHGLSNQGCYVLRVTVFSDKLEAGFNVKMVLNRLDYGINKPVLHNKIAYIT